MPALNALRISLLLGTFAAGSTPALAVAADGGDTVTAYLKAWTYKDYSTMWDYTARKSLNEQGFFAAAAKLPVPADQPKIISRASKPQAGGNAELIYVEYTGGTPATTQRTSLVLEPAGVTHPELVAHYQATITSAAPGGQAAERSVDGETLATILEKMQKAGDAVKSLRSDVAISGSMMGTQINDTGQLIFKAPDKVRLQSKTFTMNSNGKESFLYLPDAKIYMNLAGMGELELTPGIGTSAADLQAKYEPKLVGKGEIAGQEVFQLQLKPPTEAGGLPLGIGGGNGQMTLWVSKTTWMPVQASVQGMKIEYRNMKLNEGEVQDQEFVFQPPKDATAFSLGGLLGSLGGGLPLDQ